MRITGFLTTTPGGPGRQLADLELRHRRHARVEDRIRNGKDTGLRNLPYHDAAQNRICDTQLRPGLGAFLTQDQPGARRPG